MWPVERLHTELRRHRLSRTRTRDEIYLTLTRVGPCSLPVLARALAPKMDPRTIYRNVNRLLGCGILHRPSHGLIEIAPPLKQHHHHITCPQCGKKNGFLDTALEAHLEKIMAQRRRQLLSHQIELIAVCGQCSTQT